jgi:hypothetical protein
MQGLTDKQSVELGDNVGKMLVMELESETVKNKVKKLVSDARAFFQIFPKKLHIFLKYIQKNLKGDGLYPAPDTGLQLRWIQNGKYLLKRAPMG